MDPIPVDDGSQKLTGLLQIALNEIAAGRLDIATALIGEIIAQLRASGQ